jgi:hypothetical protein
MCCWVILPLDLVFKDASGCSLGNNLLQLVAVLLLLKSIHRSPGQLGWRLCRLLCCCSSSTTATASSPASTGCHLGQAQSQAEVTKDTNNHMQFEIIKEFKTSFRESRVSTNSFNLKTRLTALACMAMWTHMDPHGSTRTHVDTWRSKSIWTYAWTHMDPHGSISLNSHEEKAFNCCHNPYLKMPTCSP